MNAFTLPQRDLSWIQAKILPALRTLIKVGYFSLDVEGAAHVQKRGAAIYVGNHAGWFTLDTLLFGLAVADHVGLDSIPYGAVQDQVFKVPWVGNFFERLGGFPASMLRNPRALPPAMQRLLIYPEGTEGNCKPFWRAYQMAKWRTGFARVAATRRAAVVPMAIIGGEECLPVAATIRCLKPLLGSIVPLPLSTLPLPCRWKVIFHPPVRVDGERTGRGEIGYSELRRFSDSVQSTVQRTLDRETASHRLARIGRLFGPTGQGVESGRESSGVPATPSRQVSGVLNSAAAPPDAAARRGSAPAAARAP